VRKKSSDLRSVDILPC